MDDCFVFLMFLIAFIPTFLFIYRISKDLKILDRRSCKIETQLEAIDYKNKLVEKNSKS